jgi:hypothetical protein
MKFTYHIYESPDLIAASIETNERLRHLQVGRQILLTTDGYLHKLGHALIVEHIRPGMGYMKKKFIRYDIHVFSGSRDRHLQCSNRLFLSRDLRCRPAVFLA